MLLLSRLNHCLGQTKNILTKSRFISPVNILPSTVARLCSSKQPTEKLKAPTEGDQFKMVYRFPYIVHARLVCRLKLYQTAFIITMTGASLVSQANLFLPLVICSVSLGMLAVMGEYFRRLIGVIYVDPTQDKVKFSHLDFWGNRKDFVLPVSSVIPLSDTSENPTDIYVKLRFYDKNQPQLYISVKYGLILDKELFHRVVGAFV